VNHRTTVATLVPNWRANAPRPPCHGAIVVGQESAVESAAVVIVE